MLVQPLKLAMKNFVWSKHANSIFFFYWKFEESDRFCDANLVVLTYFKPFT